MRSIMLQDFVARVAILWSHKELDPHDGFFELGHPTEIMIYFEKHHSFQDELHLIQDEFIDFRMDFTMNSWISWSNWSTYGWISSMISLTSRSIYWFLSESQRWIHLILDFFTDFWMSSIIFEWILPILSEIIGF